MARDVIINGETMVRVRFGGHVSPSVSNIVGSSTNLSELGMADAAVRIMPRFSHQDVNIDDFGPDVPAEVLFNLAEVNIQFTLVHYDIAVLARCLQESMAGGGFATGNEGTMAPAGQPMGAGLAPLSSGNHFVSLNLLSPVLAYPWRFRSAYLADRPVEIPIGSKRTLAICNWRAIPYQPLASEILSSGAPLFDHTLDT